LWRGKQEVSLTGKASAVLRYLVERAGQLVTKDELFAAVWPQTVVSDAALASCIQELRQALRDDAKKPRYIETVHRRGYRFLPIVTTTSLVPSSKFQVRKKESVARKKKQSKRQKVKTV
jgi:DNA-binding winged helix-turn-helix (wHTH) protein